MLIQFVGSVIHLLTKSAIGMALESGVLCVALFAMFLQRLLSEQIMLLDKQLVGLGTNRALDNTFRL
jgi:hypothetical protein